MADTGNIHVTIVDGGRQPLAPDTQVLVRLLNGAQKFDGWWAKGGDITINGIPYTDTGGEQRDGGRGAALHRHFREVSDADGRAAQPGNDIPLADGSDPLSDYYWEVIWDLLAPDRFWAWVDARFAERVKELADLHAFAEEADAAHWHPANGTIGAATRSWKQTRFEVANVQLTFHETTKDKRNGVDCVVIEPDIDLYKDLLAHGLCEVIPNLATGGKTDPRLVYAMRWMATRQETGVPEFNPPFTIE